MGRGAAEGVRRAMVNARLLVAFAGIEFVLFPIPVITLFWKDQIGMSLTDIMVLQAGFGLSVGCCALVVVGYCGQALSHVAWGVVFYLCFMTIRGLQGPILANAMQRDAPAEDRASVLSIAAMLFRLSFVVAGPPIGALVDRAGMEVALGVLAVLPGALALAAYAAFSRARDPAEVAGGG